MESPKVQKVSHWLSKKNTIIPILDHFGFVFLNTNRLMGCEKLTTMICSCYMGFKHPSPWWDLVTFKTDTLRLKTLHWNLLCFYTEQNHPCCDFLPNQTTQKNGLLSLLTIIQAFRAVRNRNMFILQKHSGTIGLFNSKKCTPRNVIWVPVFCLNLHKSGQNIIFHQPRFP